MRYVLSGMAGALLVLLLGAGEPAQDVVRCRELRVVDSHGVTRVLATTRDDGAMLCVGSDAEEVPSVILLTAPNKAVVMAKEMVATKYLTRE